MIRSAPEIEDLARSVPDNGGVVFVPAFSGLLAPYWRGDARGLVCGLTAFNTKGHLARAVLESTAFQVKDRSVCVGSPMRGRYWLGRANEDDGVLSYQCVCFAWLNRHGMNLREPIS